MSAYKACNKRFPKWESGLAGQFPGFVTLNVSYFVLRIILLYRRQDSDTILFLQVEPQMRTSTNRRKLSTTVSRETQAYLENLVTSGRAESIAEAVDLAVARARRSERRARLEKDTASYFAGLPAKAAAEEAHLEASLGALADEVDFDS